MKYIETELKKRKGQVEAEEQKVKVKNAEDHLYELPENIRVNSAKKTEEMLSNQMLSGIPEVDLGIEWVFKIFYKDAVICFANHKRVLLGIFLSILLQCKNKEHHKHRRGQSQAFGRTEEQEKGPGHFVCAH